MVATEAGQVQSLLVHSFYFLLLSWTAITNVLEKNVLPNHESIMHPSFKQKPTEKILYVTGPEACPSFEFLVALAGESN